MSHARAAVGRGAGAGAKRGSPFLQNQNKETRRLIARAQAGTPRAAAQNSNTQADAHWQNNHNSTLPRQALQW